MSQTAKALMYTLCLVVILLCRNHEQIEVIVMLFVFTSVYIVGNTLNFFFSTHIDYPNIT